MHYIYKRGNLTCERQRDGNRQGQRQKDGLISHTKVGQFVSSLYFIKDLPQLAIVCGREKVKSYVHSPHLIPSRTTFLPVQIITSKHSIHFHVSVVWFSMGKCVGKKCCLGNSTGQEGRGALQHLSMRLSILKERGLRVSSVRVYVHAACMNL